MRRGRRAGSRTTAGAACCARKPSCLGTTHAKIQDSCEIIGKGAGAGSKAPKGGLNEKRLFFTSRLEILPPAISACACPGCSGTATKTTPCRRVSRQTQRQCAKIWYAPRQAARSGYGLALSISGTKARCGRSTGGPLIERSFFGSPRHRISKKLVEVGARNAQEISRALSNGIRPSLACSSTPSDELEEMTAFRRSLNVEAEEVCRVGVNSYESVV